MPFAVEERSGTITVVDEMNNYDRLLYDFEAVVTDDKDITLITNVTVHVVHSDSAFSAKYVTHFINLYRQNSFNCSFFIYCIFFSLLNTL